MELNKQVQDFLEDVYDFKLPFCGSIDTTLFPEKQNNNSEKKVNIKSDTLDIVDKSNGELYFYEKQGNDLAKKENKTEESLPPYKISPNILNDYIDRLIGKKEINKGHSTRHKANNPMIYLDEVLEQKEKSGYIISKDSDGVVYYTNQNGEDCSVSFPKIETNTQTSTSNDFYKYTTDKTTSQQDVVYDYTDGKKDSRVVEWLNKKTREKEKIRIYKDSFISNYPLHTPLFVLIELNKKQAQKENKGIKNNQNKPQISLLFKQFPKALEAVAKCSEYGHQKYKETDEDYLNFKRVDGGSKAYADAGLRHRTFVEKTLDEDSGLPHAWHIAWNALAELQLILENK